MKRMEKSIGSNLQQEVIGYSKRKSVQFSSETSNGIWIERVAVTKKQVKEMKVALMKMLRFAMGVTIKYKIRNEYIRSTV